MEAKKTIDAYLQLTADRTYEAKLKFLIICNYISLLHYPDERLDNWYAGITTQKDTDKDVGTDLYTKHRDVYCDMDVCTWKEFNVKDAIVAREVSRMLKENGFDSEDHKTTKDKANTIYVFRKKK